MLNLFNLFRGSKRNRKAKKKLDSVVDKVDIKHEVDPLNLSTSTNTDVKKAAIFDEPVIVSNNKVLPGEAYLVPYYNNLTVSSEAPSIETNARYAINGSISKEEQYVLPCSCGTHDKVTCNTQKTELSDEAFKKIENFMINLNFDTSPYAEGTSTLDICHKKWQLQETVTLKGGVLQTQHSDVRLTIKENSVAVNTVVSGSIILDVPFLRNEFKVQKTEIIVAPAVEYQLRDVLHLNKHARLELPHCMSFGKVPNMKVWWFKRVQGCIIKHAIPMVEDVLHGNPIPDIYWMKGSKRNTINIFAKHFCVILCTACEEDVEFDLRALLFHKFGDISDRLSLTLQLHLGGPLSKIRDFEQATIERMKKNKMDFLEETDINLVPKLEGALRFHLGVLEKARGNWVHVTRENGRPVYDIQQTIDIRRIAKCGNEHVINHGVKWWLQRVTVLAKTCRFYTDVVHDIDVGNADSETTATTTMHAELSVPENHLNETMDQIDSNLAILQ